MSRFVEGMYAREPLGRKTLQEASRTRKILELWEFLGFRVWGLGFRV